MKTNITRTAALLTLACILTTSSLAHAEDEFVGEINRGDVILNVDGNLTKYDRAGIANDSHRLSFQAGAQFFIADKLAVGPNLSVLREGDKILSGNEYAEHSFGLGGSFFIPTAQNVAFSLGAGFSLLGYADDVDNDSIDGYLYSGAAKLSYFINPHVSIGPGFQVTRPNYFDYESSTTRLQILIGLGVHL